MLLIHLIVELRSIRLQRRFTSHSISQL